MYRITNLDEDDETKDRKVKVNFWGGYQGKGRGAPIPTKTYVPPPLQPTKEQQREQPQNPDEVRGIIHTIAGGFAGGQVQRQHKRGILRVLTQWTP